jgi:anti-sigma B factor antagonist
MEQTIRVEDDTAHIALTGSIHVRDAGKLRATLISHIDQGQKFIIIDVTRVDLIDSSGLGVLIQGQHRAAALGGKISLTGVNGIVKEVLELSRLDKVFDIK